MKKTLTVNLGGTVYQINEDAYYLLDNYLNNLRIHFSRENDAEEIVCDMESRIAELFNEYLGKGLQVITIVEVEEVIARMGKPEDLEEEPEDGHEQPRNPKGKKVVRKLFRNIDDRILGGVLSGLSAYWGWDVTWVRICVLLLGLGIKGLFLAYLIAWVIIPVARTATEKLQMRGEDINMENIGRTVTDGFEKTGDAVKSGNTESLLRKIVNGIVYLAGLLIKILLILVAICVFPLFLVLFFVFISALLVGTQLLVDFPGFCYDLMPGIEWGVLSTSPFLMISMAVGGLFAVGIPLVAMLQLIMQCFKVWSPVSTSVKTTLVLVWIFSLMWCFFLFIMWESFLVLR